MLALLFVLLCSCYGQQNHSHGLVLLQQFWEDLGGDSWIYPSAAPPEKRWFFNSSSDYCQFWGVRCANDGFSIVVLALDNMNLKG